MKLLDARRPEPELLSKTLKVEVRVNEHGNRVLTIPKTRHVISARKVQVVESVVGSDRSTKLLRSRLEVSVKQKDLV